MNFIYEHYPEYGSEQDFSKFFSWLQDRARAAEQAHQISNSAYSRPNRNTKQAADYDQEDSSDEDFTIAPGSSFGTAAGKQKNKKGMKKELDAKVSKAKYIKQQKILADPSKVT